MFLQNEARHVLEHRHFDRLPLAGQIPGTQCEQDHLHRDEGDEVVGHDHGHELRLARLALNAGGNPAGALDDRVVGRLVEIASAPAEPRHGAMDDSPIELESVLEGQAQLREGGRAHVDDYDIGGFDQLVYRLSSVPRFQIDRQ